MLLISDDSDDEEDCSKDPEEIDCLDITSDGEDEAKTTAQPKSQQSQDMKTFSKTCKNTQSMNSGAEEKTSNAKYKPCKRESVKSGKVQAKARKRSKVSTCSNSPTSNVKSDSMASDINLKDSPELSYNVDGNKMPDYDSWNVERLTVECRKYGVRQMKRERMIKTLQLIHWGTHSSDDE